MSSILVFEDESNIKLYAGGFSDWQKRGKQLAEMDKPTGKQNKIEEADNSKKNKPTKLSYKLQRELDALPDQIEKLEQTVQTLEKQTQKNGFFEQNYEQQQPILDELQQKNIELEKAIERWDELESVQESMSEKK